LAFGSAVDGNLPSRPLWNFQTAGRSKSAAFLNTPFHIPEHPVVCRLSHQKRLADCFTINRAKLGDLRLAGHEHAPGATGPPPAGRPDHHWIGVARGGPGDFRTAAAALAERHRLASLREHVKTFVSENIENRFPNSGRGVRFHPRRGEIIGTAATSQTHRCATRGKHEKEQAQQVAISIHGLSMNETFVSSSFESWRLRPVLPWKKILK
jgi:hypothetical protein